MPPLVQAMGPGGIAKSTMSKLCKDMDERDDKFPNRPLTGDWPHVWLGATCLEVRAGGARHRSAGDGARRAGGCCPPGGQGRSRTGAADASSAQGLPRCRVRLAVRLLPLAVIGGAEGDAVHPWIPNRTDWFGVRG